MTLTAEHLQHVMLEHYMAIPGHLQPRVDPLEFQGLLEALPGQMYDLDPAQREWARTFVWGHDHDFGTFQMHGYMLDRHLHLVAALSEFGPYLEHRPQRILDVGCWTGGTTLLLAALGHNVTAIEEVSQYAAIANYLTLSFAASYHRAIVLHASLIQPKPVPWQEDHFDIAFCAGVLYHLTDPITGLRRLFEALVDGGTVFIETEISSGDDRTLTYLGPQTAGWRWYAPTLECLETMMGDVGFRHMHPRVVGSRAMVVAKREGRTFFLKAGTPEGGQ